MLRFLIWILVIYFLWRLVKAVFAYFLSPTQKKEPYVHQSPASQRKINIPDADIQDAEFEDLDESKTTQ